MFFCMRFLVDFFLTEFCLFHFEEIVVCDFLFFGWEERNYAKIRIKIPFMIDGMEACTERVV